jgi:hypothetical protein
MFVTATLVAPGSALADKSVDVPSGRTDIHIIVLKKPSGACPPFGVKDVLMDCGIRAIPGDPSDPRWEIEMKIPQPPGPYLPSAITLLGINSNSAPWSFNDQRNIIVDAYYTRDDIIKEKITTLLPVYDSSNNITSFSYAVPEPTTWSMLAVGVILIWRSTRRRRINEPDSVASSASCQ